MLIEKNLHNNVNHIGDIITSDTTSIGGLLLTIASPYLDWLGPGVQMAGSILGLCLLYWGIRKKRAETKRIEKETEYLHKQMEEKDGSHD